MSVPAIARQVLKLIAGQIGEIQGQTAALEAQIAWVIMNRQDTYRRTAAAA
jgi:hypothetical protein